jgi:hypothetical protein
MFFLNVVAAPQLDAGEAEESGRRSAESPDLPTPVHARMLAVPKEAHEKDFHNQKNSPTLTANEMRLPELSMHRGIGWRSAPR